MKLPQEVIDYIQINEYADPYALALKKSPFSDVDMKVITRQIMGRKIARVKFPFLLETPQYLYPKKESLEQASSEQTAQFKSKLIEGKSFIDLTGGMGIDTYLLGKNFQSCMYVEPNTDLHSTTKMNFAELGFDQCDTFNGTCEAYLDWNSKKYDWAYIDPSRRIDGTRKTSIANYEPNIVSLKQKLNEVADNILIKLSPMQDISECVNVLENVHQIWVISVKNDVKELLLHLKNEYRSSPLISAVDLCDREELEFSHWFNERICEIDFSTPKKYLYQPAAALIKSQLQDRHAEQLGLEKLHSNTQLFTSDKYADKYFGKVFLIKENIKLNKKNLKKALPQMKANIVTKNFPLNPTQIAQRYKLKEGGKEFLIAYTDFEGNKWISICNRVN
ncbi:MAG: hypothetical protein AAGA77_07110 [Bacteroidota bacterium]